MTTTWRAWSDGLTARVAGAVRARRAALGLTAAELADKTAVGKPLTRAVISDLETGRKKSLEVSELLTLAAALDIPPILLLLPDYPDGDVEVLPNVQRSSSGAFGWFTGGGTGPTADEPNMNEGVVLVMNAHALAEARRDRAYLPSRAAAVGDTPSDEVIADYENKVRHAERLVAMVKARLWGNDA